jgi:two-component system, OmpR family, response regulator
VLFQKPTFGAGVHPYLKHSLARPRSERRIVSHTAPLRVLVVDDNENAAEAIAAYLSHGIAECRIALGGAQAIEFGATWLPHIIVMDISMPEINGFEATLALRRDLRTNNIIILAFTALDESEVLRHLTHLMFDGYCQKGQSPAALVALIEYFTSQAHP